MELSPFSSIYSFYLFILSCMILNANSFASTKPLCHDEEKLALFQFKQSFALNLPINQACSSSFPKFSSWKIEDGNDNCCNWNGVDCDMDTGFVIGLDLSSSCLYGSIDSNSSLFQLVHLQKLNLANNDFNYSKIPISIGRLLELRYLNLSSSVFSGQIPFEISQLKKLLVLDLSYNIGTIIRKRLLELRNPNLRTLVLNLTRLEGLRLSGVDISSSVPDFLANFTSLKLLVMRDCRLRGKFSEKIFQLPNLERVNLIRNPRLYGHLPEFNSNNSLKELRLAGTGLYGELPISIGNLISLESLILDECNFTGSIPFSIGNLPKLRILSLLTNKFSGSIPYSMGNLTKLDFLQLSNNDFSDETGLPWLSKQSQLVFLGISNMNLGVNVVSSLGNLTNLMWLFLGSNPMRSQFPTSINNMSFLMVLNMNDNNMNGKLPQWLGNFSHSLQVLTLKDNMFEGSIPNTFEKESNLRFIDLSNNRLQGQVPRSLSNCEMLETIVLKSNQLNDVFPSWLGILPNLRVLVLQSNQFHGAIGEPRTDFEFPKLRIIDLSYNNFTGLLPLKYINHWNAMKNFSPNSTYIHGRISFEGNAQYTYNYFYSITITHKGSRRDFPRILRIFSIIDLSCNRFDGEIPYIIGNLRGLQSLNLSHNTLTGQIPSSLGDMKQLEALDLSHNKLSGNIPQQLSQLTFLAIFNASYNNLSGRIPQGNQLDTMENSSYEGNPSLCGEPLSKKCGDFKVDQVPITTLEEDDEMSFFEFGWKVVVIGYGCGVVFGILVGNWIITWKQEWFMKTFKITPNKRHGRRIRQRHGC